MHSSILYQKIRPGSVSNLQQDGNTLGFAGYQAMGVTGNN
jgi:hypothetical protein